MPARPRADERVARLELVAEPRHEAAGVDGVEPERDLGQFHGHRVEIDAVDESAQGRDVVFEVVGEIVLANQVSATGLEGLANLSEVANLAHAPSLFVGFL